MTAEVDDGFFQLFERRIFVRGEAYYDAGNESQDQVSEFPHEALNCVRWYTMYEFPKYRGLTEGDWHAVKRIFEVLYCIPDLDTTYTHEVMDTVW